MDVSLQSGEAPPEEAPLPEQPTPAPAAPPDPALQDALVGMDVSAQTLRDVKFREKFRGYHPDDVDEFLEQVAEGITYLQGRLREAQEGGGGEGPDLGAPNENNEALRRTLVLAQRTAELAVQEARHEAERIQSQAKQHAETIVTRAEDAARRTVDETNARLRDEVGKLEAARERLRADVDELERYLEEQRQQLHASLSDALTKVGNVLPPPSRPAPEPEPAEVPPVPWPEPVERAALWEPPELLDTPPLAVDELADPEPMEPLTVADLDPDREVDRDFDRDMDDHEEEAGSIWAAASPADDEGWATSVPAAPLDDEDDDPFIAELRRAITDTTPLGPRDDMPLPAPMTIEQPQEQEVPGGRRFRRKRR